MKRQWDLDELIEHFTLSQPDLDLIETKSLLARLGFAVVLTFFRYEGRFPDTKSEAPRAVVDHVAKQLRVAPETYLHYPWEGRSVKRHRAQIRAHLGFRTATARDADALVDWLVSQVLDQEQRPDRLRVLTVERFRALNIEPPTPDRMERLLRTALHAFEVQFTTVTMKRLAWIHHVSLVRGQEEQASGWDRAVPEPERPPVARPRRAQPAAGSSRRRRWCARHCRPQSVRGLCGRSEAVPPGAPAAPTGSRPAARPDR